MKSNTKLTDKEIKVISKTIQEIQNGEFIIYVPLVVKVVQKKIVKIEKLKEVIKV